jgi:hypothetical protein
MSAHLPAHGIVTRYLGKSLVYACLCRQYIQHTANSSFRRTERLALIVPPRTYRMIDSKRRPRYLPINERSTNVAAAPERGHHAPCSATGIKTRLKDSGGAPRTKVWNLDGLKEFVSMHVWLLLGGVACWIRLGLAGWTRFVQRCIIPDSPRWLGIVFEGGVIPCCIRYCSPRGCMAHWFSFLFCYPLCTCVVRGSARHGRGLRWRASRALWCCEVSEKDSDCRVVLA